MDYYKVLGLTKNASKEEIKESFRNLAKQFHPDKHSDSPKSVKDGATLRFKQASEAYEVLIDDRKRADYNLRYRTTGFASDGYRSRNNYNSGYNNSYGSGSGSGSGSGYGYSKAANGDSFVSRFEITLRFLTTRAFLLNLAFAGVLLGGSIIVDKSRDAIWKMHNPGKSFEEAMESIEKGKSIKDKR